MNLLAKESASTDVALTRTLGEVARRCGTPVYAFDVRRMRAQAAKLRAAFPDSIEILYSLKANASLGICDVLADCGLGADVASAGELATAVAAGFPSHRIFVAGPYKSPETLAQLRALPDAVVSIDSVGELETLAGRMLANRTVLRLRPDFGSNAVVQAGSESRFGVLMDELDECRRIIASSRLRVVGFHVFAGSQVLQADGVIQHLRGAFELSMRAADRLELTPEFLNLGGGFGIPYAASDCELDLAPIAAELNALAQRARPARLVLELGRYLVAQAGWYLTTVVGRQTFQGRPAVVVDGGTHQRADMCGLCLRSRAKPPLVFSGAARAELVATDVLGCLSLPADVMAQASQLPPLAPGDVLAFGNAGAYGVWASPAIFHGSPLPAEAAFDGDRIFPMREAQPAASILDQQRHVIHNQ